MSNTKRQIATENTELFMSALRESKHEEYMACAKKFDDFYCGDQWDAADKAKLDAEGRPALTLNVVLSTINAIIGEQLERKIDIRFSAGPGGDGNTAFALNAVTRAILNENSFDDVEEEVFADGVITDRGFYDIRLDFEKNVNGDIVIQPEDGLDVILDPAARSYDPKDWNQVFISRWMTPDEIEAEYGPKEIEEIRRIAEDGSAVDSDAFEYAPTTFGDGHLVELPTGESRRLVRVRVVERQFYQLTKRLHFVDLETGDLRPTPWGMNKERAEAFANRYNVGLIEKPAKRLRHRVSVDSVLLYDDWSIYRTFTIIPFFPYFRRGRPFGVMRNLVDPQQLLNKTSSQELHIVNTTANSGWMIQEDSLVDMDSDELEERGAETGLVLTYKRGYEKPDKITPNSIPTGIDRISQKAANTIREVSAINAAMIGTNRADQSGKALDRSISQGQVQVSVILKNLRRSRRLVAEKVLELIQDFYTEARYFDMVGEDNLFGGSNKNQTIAINEEQSDGSILHNVTTGKYSIEVSHAPAGGSFHQAQFAEAVELRNYGVQIPDHILVQHSSLHRKQELVEFLKQAQGFGEKTDFQKQLEQFQIESDMQRVRNELDLQTAEIENKMALARQAMAKAESLEGFNQAQLEYARLAEQRDSSMRDAALRIALAARSHQNSQALNDKRISSQILLESMKQAANLTP